MVGETLENALFIYPVMHHLYRPSCAGFRAFSWNREIFIGTEDENPYTRNTKSKSNDLNESSL